MLSTNSPHACARVCVPRRRDSEYRNGQMERQRGMLEQVSFNKMNSMSMDFNALLPLHHALRHVRDPQCTCHAHGSEHEGLGRPWPL